MTGGRPPIHESSLCQRYVAAEQAIEESGQFRQLVAETLDRDMIGIATVALHATGSIESIRRRPDITLFRMDSGNRHGLASTLLEAIR